MRVAESRSSSVSGLLQLLQSTYLRAATRVVTTPEVSCLAGHQP
jgi:hypothetical protein